MRLALVGLIGIVLFGNVFAAETTAISAKERENVKQALIKLSKTAGQEFTAGDIQRTAIPGLLQVTTGTNVFYVSTDGQYVVAGEMLDVNQDLENWSLTEKAMRVLRLELLADAPEADMIIFPATAPKIGTVTVFTDIDCGYCRQLHSQMQEYNDAGIEIRYLGYPRAGVGSKSYDKTVTVWCSEDRQAAMTAAKKGEELANKTCENPVAMQLELGKKLGITGTPTLIFNNGAKIPGYVPPKELKKFLEE